MVAVSMQSRVTITPIESIPPTVDVKHIDELSNKARAFLYQVVCEDGQIAVESEVQAELANCDVVKFTEYYRITVVEPHASGHVTA